MSEETVHSHIKRCQTYSKRSKVKYELVESEIRSMQSVHSLNGPVSTKSLISQAANKDNKKPVTSVFPEAQSVQQISQLSTESSLAEACSSKQKGKTKQRSSPKALHASKSYQNTSLKNSVGRYVSPMELNSMEEIAAIERNLRMNAALETLHFDDSNVSIDSEYTEMDCTSSIDEDVTCCAGKMITSKRPLMQDHFFESHISEGSLVAVIDFDISDGSSEESYSSETR